MRHKSPQSTLVDRVEPGPIGSQPDGEAIRSALNRLLASTQFAKSPRASRFLRYIVNAALAGGDTSLKEYVLGVEVFDRSPSFDPRIDTIVRVEAVKLRNRLRDYYRGPGRTDPLMIEVPRGAYSAVFRARTPGKRRSASGSEQPASLAVLPFTDLSGDRESEYFSDGLAEEIINALTRIPGLKVIARTSAFAFKGKNIDVREIARTLGVSTVLEGSVRRAGSRVRITTRLVAAVDHRQLWSQRYDRELTDVFAVQDEIAAAIAEVLRVKLPGKLSIARPHEPSLPAYEAFLKGRHLFYSLAPGAISRAEEYFKQAIGLDPQWGDPHSALARQYFRLGALDLRPLREMMPLARAEALKALELVPSEPTARAVLGAIAGSYDYDWNEAGQQFRLATASDALPPEVHDMYAVFYLMPLGRFQETIEQQTIATAHDPLNVLWRSNQFTSLLGAGMYERAIFEARKVLEFDDRNYVAHFVVASGLFFQGRLAEARAPAEEAFRLAPWHAGVVGLLAGLLAQTNERDRAEKLIANIRGMIPFGMITYHLVLSEIDAAIDWYERMIEQRQPIAAELSCAGYFRPLRSSPRWPKLAKMMNLPATV